MVTVDNFTRAEELQYNLEEVDDGSSEKLFVSIFLKGQPNVFNTFCTLNNFSIDEKKLSKTRKYLLNCKVIIGRRMSRLNFRLFLGQKRVSGVLQLTVDLS